MTVKSLRVCPAMIYSPKRTKEELWDTGIGQHLLHPIKDIQLVTGLVTTNTR